MNFHIRKATKQDMPAVLGLIQQLADYEKEPDAVEISVSDLERDGFGENPLFNCYVAEVDNKILGMALFYFRYSTWKGKTVHLEDLVVSEEFRGKGLGTALFKKMMEYGKKQNVRRIEWAVLDWNSPAIKFYEKAGATLLKDWYLVQFDRESYSRFLENS